MTNKNNQKFYSGTSGLALTMPKSEFPPEFQDKTRLAYYASLFNSLEINSSFYKVPMAVTVAKWAETVPDDFKFTFKLWKSITHNKWLEFDPEDVDHFIKTIDHAGEKKGCLLVQFPPSISILSIDQLKKLLKCIVNADPLQRWLTAVEFRNRSWYRQDVYELLYENNISLVIHDHPASATPLFSPASELVYVRFHGIEGDYKGSYRLDFLQERAKQIQEWLKEGKTVYTYFNNTIGDAVSNLVTLNELVKIL